MATFTSHGRPTGASHQTFEQYRGQQRRAAELMAEYRSRLATHGFTVCDDEVLIHGPSEERVARDIWQQLLCDRELCLDR